VVRVAQTIADLRERDRVEHDDVLLALSLRQRSGAEAVAAA
jgi:predicted ATPase with chaperone activity